MKLHGQNHNEWSSRFAIGAAAASVAALLMYILDPQEGRKRRAAARDKAMKGRQAISEFASTKAKSLQERVKQLSQRGKAVKQDLSDVPPLYPPHPGA
jgi:gas vesicle protein